MRDEETKRIPEKPIEKGIRTVPPPPPPQKKPEPTHPKKDG
jgi:hypothetical protein